MKRYENYIASPDAIWFSSVPDTWRATKMRELFSQRNTKVSDKDYPALSVGKMGIVPQLDSAVKTDNGDNRKLICKGDFAINSRSDRKGSGGISRYDGSASLIITVLKPHEALNGDFYHYLLRSYYFSEEFYRNGRGLVSDLWTTRWDEMKNIYIPVPPREEQDQIVRYLDWKVSEINHLINGYQKQITLLKEQRVAVINKAVTKGINSDVEMIYSGHEHIGMIPSTWNVCRIKDFCQLQNGISKGGDYFGSGFPFINYSDVYKNAVIPNDIEGLIQSTENEQDRYSVQRGDYFFTRTSETLDEVGFSSACVKTIENACFSGFLIRVRPFKDIMDIEYGKYYFRAYIHRLYFTKEMNLVTRASLGQTLLKNLPVLLPCREEQKKIADYLDENVKRIDKVLEDIEKQIELLKEYRTRLISDVVTGQIDVRDVIIPDYKSEADEDIAGDDADYDEMESEVSSDE